MCLILYSRGFQNGSKIYRKWKSDMSKAKELKENGKAIFWKEVEIFYHPGSRCRSILTPIQHVKITPGWFVSNRKNAELTLANKTYGDVAKGIHIYTKIPFYYKNRREEAEFRLIPVTCYIKDLVAFGKYNEAVFMKVFITKTDFKDEKITKGR